LSVAPVAVLPTPSVTCFTGLPTPAGSLSKPFPAVPVTPLTAALTPDVALSVMVFTPPVVIPTPLFKVPVAALVVWPMTPGFFAAAVVGVAFLAAVGVGLVPSGFAAFTGVFLTGVAFDVDVVAFEAVEDTGFFAAATGVFFAGVVLEVEGVELAPAAGVAFFAVVETLFAGVPIVLFAGGTFAGVPTVPVVFAGAVVFVVLSFAGAFLTGVAAGVDFVAVDVAFDAAGAAFFTGVVVFEAAVDVVLDAVAGAFFAVC
jgi:hypothetical protein